MHKRDPEVDGDKSQLLFYHILNSAQKWKQRDVAHSKLTNQLEKIRNMNVDDQLVNHLNELELRVSEVVQRENKILTTQQEEDLYNQALQSHLDELEQKLVKYQQTHEQREKILGQLESGYRGKIEKKQRLIRLQGQITQLETLVTNLKHRKRIKNRIRITNISKTLGRIKRKVTNIQKQL